MIKLSLNFDIQRNKVIISCLLISGIKDPFVQEMNHFEKKNNPNKNTFITLLSEYKTIQSDLLAIEVDSFSWQVNLSSVRYSKV